MFAKKTSKERGFSKEENECDHAIRGFDKDCDEMPAYDDAGERIYVKVIVVVEYCKDCGKNFGYDTSPAGIDDCYHS
jgi:hypothetical protein